MSQSQSENIVATARIGNKLVLDSEEQEKRLQQDRKIQEQLQKRKDQKRKKRQQAERIEQQKLKEQQQKQKKYEQPELMFEEDSDDGVEFRRVVKKIRRMYPNQINKYDSNKKKNDFIVDDYEDSDDSSDSDSSGDSNSQQKKKQRKQKKIKKPERSDDRKVEKKQVQKKKVEIAPRKQKIKIEGKSDKKQNLVREVSVRWWYALPQWPPLNFPYEQKLSSLGYRILDPQKFKLEDDIVGGMQKVMPVDGYKGVYRSKTKLIDVRPKQSAPTLNNFRNMSIEQLTNILRKALAVQMEQLKNVKYQQKGQEQLLVQLERELIKLK